MSIEVINRFNGGNGGVEIVIQRTTGRFGMGGAEEIEEISEFLDVKPAVELGLEIIDKALKSMNMDLPLDIKERILRFVPRYIRNQRTR